MIEGNEPAFPRPMSKLSDCEWESSQQGMSLRDYFAGEALKGLLSRPHQNPVFEVDARMAYQYADLMLKVRKEKC